MAVSHRSTTRRRSSLSFYQRQVVARSSARGLTAVQGVPLSQGRTTISRDLHRRRVQIMIWVFHETEYSCVTIGQEIASRVHPAARLRTGLWRQGGSPELRRISP